jgi:hypothetical protein
VARRRGSRHGLHRADALGFFCARLHHLQDKFKHLLRKAAARSAETICVTIGEILRTFTPNAPPISESQAMPNPKSIML